MRTIYKTQLKLIDIQTVELPCFAKFLSVQLQNNVICLWSEVMTDLQPYQYKIFIIGTGYPVPEDAVKYIGTVQQDGFVWHVYQGM